MSDTKCLEANSIPVPRQLAAKLKGDLRRLASDAAIFVQQIHYWSQKEVGEVVDGVRWVYNSYENWLTDLPWLSDHSFRKIRSYLSEHGIIIMEQLGLRHGGRDRSYWYRVNYDHEWILNSSDGTVEIESAPSDEQSSNHIETEITSENTSNTIPVVDESESEEIRQAIALAPFNQTPGRPENTVEQHTQDLSKEIKSTILGEEILEKYQDQLKTYGIYTQTWSGDTLIIHPRIVSVLSALGKISPARAERSIQAFLKWLRSPTTKEVENKYSKLEQALRQSWN